MTRRWMILGAVVSAFLVATVIHAQGSSDATTDPWKRADVGTTASFRGLSAVSADVVWASGTHGTVIRTVDGGKTWDVRVVEGAANQDFRGIRAFDANNAVIMSTGNAEKGLATIYRTNDGGKTWTQAFAPKTVGVFFDSIAFWDRQRGVVLSDPVDGHFVLFRTADGGATWTQIPTSSLPAALKGEGSFAASNSCIALQGEKNIWFVTGGASVARVVRSNDGGETWSVAETPVRPVNASSGLFSVAFITTQIGVAVGGDYTKPSASPEPTMIRTKDGGKTWEAFGGPAEPRSLFFSSVAFVPPSTFTLPAVEPPAWPSAKAVLVTVGPAGAAIDRGNWKVDSAQNLNAVTVPVAETAWAVGPEGFVARRDISRYF